MIGYGLAIELFKLIDENQKVKDTWAGIMEVNYSYGGKIKNGQYASKIILTNNKRINLVFNLRKIVLNVFNQRKVSKTYNVIGMIKGTVEPG